MCMCVVVCEACRLVALLEPPLLPHINTDLVRTSGDEGGSHCQGSGLKLRLGCKLWLWYRRGYVYVCVLVQCVSLCLFTHAYTGMADFFTVLLVNVN